MNKKDFTFNKTDLFDDLFEEKFDLSWHKNTESKVFTVTPSEIDMGVEDDQTVLYKYNNEFFRSDDFITEHVGTHILFAGCSETEGIGGNIEDAWSKILYDKISSETQCSGFFNLSRSGWGWSRIIINSLIYFKKYGYPDFMFVLLPNNQRKFIFNDTREVNNNIWNYWQQYPEFYKGQNSLMKDSTVKEYQEDYVNFLISWKLFTEFCKNNNIKMIFSTWDYLDKYNLDRYNFFDNYLSMKLQELTSFTRFYYTKNEATNTDVRKRDGHGGKITHNFWATSFYNKYKDIKK